MTITVTGAAIRVSVMERTPVRVPATTMPVDLPAGTGRTTPEAVMATPAVTKATAAVAREKTTPAKPLN
jgi:hypothetical protein